MAGTKILVLHMRQIVKASALIIFGLLLLFALMMFFFQRDGVGSSVMGYIDQLEFNPGTYLAQVTLSYKPAKLEITVTEDEITSIVLNPLTENQEIFYPLLQPTMDQIAQEIIQNQSLDVTHTYENATTSLVLVNAISRALDQAVVLD